MREVEKLVKSVGMKTGGIFRMDAGRRSTHSNAYFTGFGKTKRIVLFDTLIGRHTRDEILAVLAHELGHFKLKHIWKSYAVSHFVTFAGFYGIHLMLNWDLLLLDFPPPALPIIHRPLSHRSALAEMRVFPDPFYTGWSRRHEKQADAFAIRLQSNPQALALALKKMGAHNLSSLTPHPFYAWFYYSHPPLPERVALLEDQARG